MFVPLLGANREMFSLNLACVASSFLFFDLAFICFLIFIKLSFFLECFSNWLSSIFSFGNFYSSFRTFSHLLFLHLILIIVLNLLHPAFPKSNIYIWINSVLISLSFKNSSITWHTMSSVPLHIYETAFCHWQTPTN